MSLFPTSFFPRSMFDYDWTRPSLSHPGWSPSTLDLFDPFDLLDVAMRPSYLQWVDQPDYVRSLLQQPAVPKVPQKYRITVDCAGYDPASIKTSVSPDKRSLTVCGKEGEPAAHDQADYMLREFRRTYRLPDNVDTERMASFVTGYGSLVVEFPIRDGGEQSLALTGPSVRTDEASGRRVVHMSLDVPNSIEPGQIRVTCKDRDLIVQAEDRVEKPDGVSQFHYYRRTVLPEDTDVGQLRCVLENNQLWIEAPCNAEHRRVTGGQPRNIPIEYRQERKTLQSGQSEQSPQQQPQQQQSEAKQQQQQPQQKQQQREA